MSDQSHLDSHRDSHRDRVGGSDRNDARQGRPILLVFTLGAARERRRRRLLPTDAGDLERTLHDSCLRQTLEVGRACDCDIVVAAPEATSLPPGVRRITQRGRDFGRRLRAAVDDAADSGRPLVVVGSDTPGLGVDHLRSALASLAENPGTAVVGPARDGGFYLLAVDPAGADLEASLDAVLSEVTWRSHSTLTSLRQALANRNVSTTLLEPQRDLDRPADLERWLRSLQTTGATTESLGQRLIVSLLRLLVARRRSVPVLAAVPRRTPAPRLLRGRAPPRLSSIG